MLYSSCWLGKAATLLGLLAGSAGAQAQTVHGVWFVQEESAIEIYDCGAATLCGRVVWLIRPKLDSFNPDLAKRDRSVCGTDVMWGLRQTQTGRWDQGTIYDPRSGRQYDLQLHFDPKGLLTARAYLVVPVVGKSLALRRAGSADAGRTC